MPAGRITHALRSCIGHQPCAILHVHLHQPQLESSRWLLATTAAAAASNCRQVLTHLVGAKGPGEGTPGKAS